MILGGQSEDLFKEKKKKANMGHAKCTFRRISLANFLVIYIVKGEN